MSVPIDNDALGPELGDEVSVGPRRRSVIAIGAAVAVVTVVAAFSVMIDRSPHRAARTTLPSPTSASTVPASSASTLATSPASSASSLPVVNTAASTSTSTLPSIAFDHPTGLAVYVTPVLGGAPTAIGAFELDTGQYHEINLGRDVGWYFRALDGAGGMVIDGGAVMLVANGTVRVLDDGGTSSGPDAPNGRVAAGPDAGVWVRGFDPPAIELVDASGVRTGRRYDLPVGAELFGSMADGRPVIRGADERLVVIDADGTRHLLAEHALGPVEAGRFAETQCDLTQRCHVIGHIDERTIELGALDTDDGTRDGTRRRFRFQPDGPLVAISTRAGVSLLDTTTGAVVDAVTDALDGRINNEELTVRFLPGGLGLVAQTVKGLVFVDLTGRRLGQIPGRFARMPGPTLLGVGSFHDWPG